MTTTKKTTTTRKPKATVVKGESPSIPSLPRNPFVFEVLDVVSRQRSKQKKVQALKKYEDISLKMVLIWNFDESVISMLPEGDVPYSRVEEQSAFNDTLSASVEKLNTVKGLSNADEFVRKRATSIRKEYQNFYNYLLGGNPTLSSLRRETMFMQMLEGLHPREAEIMVLVKDKKLQTRYNITKDAITKAYTDIQWGGRS